MAALAARSTSSEGSTPREQEANLKPEKHYGMRGTRPACPVKPALEDLTIDEETGLINGTCSQRQPKARNILRSPLLQGVPAGGGTSTATTTHGLFDAGVTRWFPLLPEHLAEEGI